jgi:hypothetical protein
LEQRVGNPNLFREASLMVENICMDKNAYRNSWNGTIIIGSLWWEHPILANFKGF